MTTDEINEVKEFWQNRAQEQIDNAEVTHQDVWQRWLEIEHIKRWLNITNRVIDVGCGNGYTTNLIAPLVEEIVGIDYSENMINRAIKSAYKVHQEGPQQNIIFKVCNVLELDPEKLGFFDVAISERCLINLTDWESQQQAIANIASILKPDGLFLFVEGSKSGRERLNELRQLMGLDTMPKVWHNLDFDETELLKFLDNYFIVEQKLYFGIYDFLSRVAYPLIIAPEQPHYDSPFNKVAAQLALERQEFADISRVIFLVLRKKSEYEHH